MKLAYLVNQHPLPNHTFVRQEIRALERRGFSIERFAIRRPLEPTPAVDPLAEAPARVLLERGLVRLGLGTTRFALAHPARLLASLRLALRWGRGSRAGVARHLAYLVEAVELAGACARARVDHLHAHFATNSATVAALCRALGGPPFSFTAHGLDDLTFDSPTGLRAKVERAAFVVTVSRFGRERMLAALARAECGTIHLVRCGIGREFLAAPLAAPTDRPRLVAVGRLAPEKGLDVLLEAAAALVKGGTALDLVVVGDGPLRAVLARRAAELSLAGRVSFTGWLGPDGVRAQIEAARALVLASRRENLPIVLMEALALGRPVIATDVGAVSELVSDGVNGWLVPSDDAEGLARAMRQALAASPAELTALGRAGASRVRERHDADRQSGLLAALFRGEATG